MDPTLLSAIWTVLWAAISAGHLILGSTAIVVLFNEYKNRPGRGHLTPEARQQLQTQPAAT